jgi:PAS domain S-box-containing protein
MASSDADWQLDRSQLSALLALIPDAAVMVGADGRIQAINELATELLRSPRDELVGAPLEDLLPERFRAGHAQRRGEFHAHPRVRRMGAGLDLWARRGDGTEIPVDISLAPVAAPDGTVVIATIRDMTERRRQQVDQAQLAAIVASTEDAIVATTPDGAISSWNPGATRLLGYEPSEIIGQPVSTLVPESLREQLAADRERVLRGERIGPVETVRRRHDGLDLDVEVTLSAVRDETGRVLGVAAVIRDITDRVRARAQLARAQQQHDQIVRLADRERIARDLHDLVIQRIFAVGLTLQAMARRAEDRPDIASRLTTAVDQLDATITEIRSTIFDLERHHAPDASVRARVLDLLAELGPSLGHEPVVHFDGPVDTLVSPDVADHVLAVLREALTNVARHARATATRVDLSAGDEVMVRVADNGIGIGTPQRTSGIRNMAERAEALGGRLDVDQPPTGGTQLVWRAPLVLPAGDGRGDGRGDGSG